MSAAIRGPFAQFQNLDGDLASLTKLILELVRKVPGLDPDEHIVKTLVETFRTKCSEIIARSARENTEVEKKENVAETSVAKLFEEVKIMFQDLPSRIEHRVDPEFRRRKRFRPMMLEELLHITKGRDSRVAVLMALSVFKNDFPWIYEIGNETLKLIQKKKSVIERQIAVRGFLEAVDFTVSHPMMREMTEHSKEYHMMFRETQHFLEDYFHRYVSEIDQSE